MKKNHFLLAMAVAGIALFSSCSQNEDVSVEDESVQLFTIQVASSGDGLQTRAGRPLYASDANQDIQNVKVMIKDNVGVVKYANLIDNWQTVSSPYTISGHGREYTLALKGPDKLANGTYTIVAVGYSNGTGYSYSPVLTNIVKDYTLSDNITATGDAEEVFAGEASVAVANESFDPVTVTLHRQVAGALGYFTKIPAEVGGTAAAKLRLVTRSKNTKVAFENFNSNFTETGTGAKYIVNGSGPAVADAKFSDNSDANELYTINLSDWFTESGGSLDTNADGILDENDTWKHPANVETVVTKGSVFSGKFIIPFALATGKRTMELQLLDATDNVLKSWGVNIPTSDLATGKTNPEVNDESVSIFNIVRNHMYNLGLKTTHTPYKDDNHDGENDNPNPDPDPDPTPDPSDGDDPQDLSKTQELILKVNDNWELIHKMELE